MSAHEVPLLSIMQRREIVLRQADAEHGGELLLCSMLAVWKGEGAAASTHAQEHCSQIADDSREGRGRALRGRVCHIQVATEQHNIVDFVADIACAI